MAAMSTDGCVTIEAGGEQLLLCPQRAAWWAAARVLFIADVHLAKDDRFRRAGVPVPAATLLHDLDQLGALVRTFAPDTLVVLGDLLHARPVAGDHALDALAAWRREHAQLEVQVIRGNHDAHAGPPPEALGFTVCEEACVMGPFELRHHPRPQTETTTQENVDHFALAGHVHPGVSVTWARHHGARFPCFHLTERQLVLPAFGAFTGLSVVSGGRRYAIADGRVMDVTALCGAR